jgi:hypothetical protein
LPPQFLIFGLPIVYGFSSSLGLANLAKTTDTQFTDFLPYWALEIAIFSYLDPKGPPGEKGVNRAASFRRELLVLIGRGDKCAKFFKHFINLLFELLDE